MDARRDKLKKILDPFPIHTGLLAHSGQAAVLSTFPD
jgi:hypothetical protein